MEERSLPVPARQLWASKRNEFANAMNELIPNLSWRIGGGTVLASQWRHRNSTDIDLKVPPKTGLDRLRPDYGSNFDEKMKRMGATAVEHRSDQVVVEFNGGKIDVFEGATVPELGSFKVSIGGREEEILSNSQILAGKLLGRGTQSPTRDLFDIATALRMDRESLETAVNC